MRSAAALLLIATLALSGCGAKDEPAQTFVTCSGGQTVAVPANMTATPTAACPPPPPPSVALGDLSTDMRVYRAVTFGWKVLPGGHPAGAHSMLSEVRVSTVSNPDTSTLKGPDSYGVEVARKEHQNLPTEPSGDYTFKEPGMYYVRVYATILADDLASKDYWSPEQMVMVADVAATGKTTTVTHPAGNAAGKLDPGSVDLKLGDGVILKNADVQARIFTPAAACAQFKEAITVASMASSEVLVFKAPGTCAFTTDDVQPQTLTVNVGA